MILIGSKPIKVKTGLPTSDIYAPTKTYFDKSWKINDIEKQK